jgi:hypothetical protein
LEVKYYMKIMIMLVVRMELKGDLNGNVTHYKSY